MQKNKIISITFLSLFILTSNTKLFSENETKNTNVDSAQQQQVLQQKETFFQKHKGAIITASTFASLLVASAIIYEIRKKEKKASNNPFEQKETREQNKKLHDEEFNKLLDEIEEELDGE
jgi:hypothetical protein